MKYKKMKKYRKQQKICYNLMVFFAIIAVAGVFLAMNENLSAIWINLIGLVMFGGGGFIAGRLARRCDGLEEVLKNEEV